MELRKDFRFEASHVLPRHPGKCSRLHGHSWQLTVCVEGSVDPQTGFVLDYALISEKVKPLIDELDHRHLGQWDKGDDLPWDVRGKDVHGVEWLPSHFYPSSENLIVWIGQQLLSANLNWSTLILHETCTSTCVLTRTEFIRSNR